MRTVFVRTLTLTLSRSLCSPAFSIVFSEMEHAKKDEDPTADVCPELSNHEVRMPKVTASHNTDACSKIHM